MAGADMQKTKTNKKKQTLEFTTTFFIISSHNFPINMDDGAFTVHAKS